MDVVGSILKRMTAPPVMDEKERKKRQNELELERKRREEDQKRIQSFREEVTKRVTVFDQDESQGPRLTFDPMDKLRRSIIHDVAESCELVPLSFGEEEVDRHVVIFRQHTVPSEPELLAMRRNEIYVPPKEKEVEEEHSHPRMRTNNSQPEYLQKYQKHFGGLAVAKDAAKTTVTQRSYGFVSSEQKKDKRTIEETLADIRARKKQKTNTERTQDHK